MMPVAVVALDILVDRGVEVTSAEDELGIKTLPSDSALWVPRISPTSGSRGSETIGPRTILAGSGALAKVPAQRSGRGSWRPQDQGTTLRRAFPDAVSAPSGPVFVALPMDVLYDPAPNVSGRDEVLGTYRFRRRRNLFRYRWCEFPTVVTGIIASIQDRYVDTTGWATYP